MTIANKLFGLSVAVFIAAGFMFFATQAKAAEKVKADPCNGLGRIALMADKGYINPIDKVTIKSITDTEIMYQKGALTALEYKTEYNKEKHAKCMTGEPQVISIASFKILYGWIKFNAFIGERSQSTDL